MIENANPNKHPNIVAVARFLYTAPRNDTIPNHLSKLSRTNIAITIVVTTNNHNVFNTRRLRRDLLLTFGFSLSIY